MKYNTDMYDTSCTCRSADCTHNLFSEERALNNLVNAFARAMKAKLKKKRLQGFSGWSNPDWTPEDMMDALKTHLKEGDPVDIANLAAFIWNRQGEKEASNGSAE